MEKFEIENWQQFAFLLTRILGSSYEIAFYADDKNIFQTKDFENVISKNDLKKLKNKAENYQIITNKAKKIITFIFFIKDAEQKIVGTFLINHNASSNTSAIDKLIKSLNLQDFFQESTKRSQRLAFSDSIEDVIYNVVDPKFLDSKMILTPDQKKAVINKLYEQDIFSRRGAVSTVAKVLRMSEPTVYSYLLKIKKGN